MDSPSANVNAMSLKVELWRGGAVVQRRRVRVASFDFEGVLRALGRYVGGARYTLGYVDDEGDVVLVGSEEEWAECLAVMGDLGAGCVRLRVDMLAEADMRGGDAAAGKCKNCEHAVTGIVDGYCCRRCVKKPGQHGPRCERRGLGGAADSVARADADASRGNSDVSNEECRAAKAEAEERCKNCEHTVTGIVDGYCCWKCAKKPGQHGPRCKRQAVGGKPAGAAELAVDAPHVEVEAAKCKNCEHAVTGIVDGYCCRRCVKKPGQHGPRCERRGLGGAADSVAKADADASRGSCEIRQLEEGDATAEMTGGRVRFADAEDVETVPAAAQGEVPARKCKNCPHAVTGLTADYCCQRCSRVPGAHGMLCLRAPVVLNEGAAVPAASSNDAVDALVAMGFDSVGREELAAVVVACDGDVTRAVALLCERV